MARRRKRAATTAGLQPRAEDAQAVDRAVIHDVAKAADVSFVTVSRAFNDHPSVLAGTRERILSVARRLGYRPRPVMDAGIVYIAAPQPVPESSWNDLSALLMSFSAGGPESPPYMRVGPACALPTGILPHLIGVAAFALSGDALSQVKSPGIPRVAFNVEVAPEGWNIVTTDFFQEGYTAGRFLARSGHERVAVVVEDPDSIEGAAHIKGCREALRGRDLLVLNLAELGPASAARGIFEFNRTAALLLSEARAPEILKTLQWDMGVRVPQDLSVIALEHTARPSPALHGITTLSRSWRDLGVAAMSVFHERAGTDGLPVRYVKVPSVLAEQPSVADVPPASGTA